MVKTYMYKMRCDDISMHLWLDSANGAHPCCQLYHTLITCTLFLTNSVSAGERNVRRNVRVVAEGGLMVAVVAVMMIDRTEVQLEEKVQTVCLCIHV